MDELTLLRNIAQTAQMTRDRQRTYFRTKSTEVLALSKSAEKQLDDLLTQYQDGIAASQDDLFKPP